MSELKKILNVSSFSQIVGATQPSETCPMIDDHISNLSHEIADLESTITEYEEFLAQEENSEEPDSNSINKYQDKINELLDKLESPKNTIKNLENDRKTLAGIRRDGLAQRTHIIDLLERSLIYHNDQCFLFTDSLKNETPSYSRSNMIELLTNYRDINQNYEKLINWLLAWDDCIDSFLSAFPSEIVQINKQIKESKDFLATTIALEKQILKTQNLSLDLFYEACRVFDDCSYRQSIFIEPEQNKEIIYASKQPTETRNILVSSQCLDLELVYEKYLYYLNPEPEKHESLLTINKGI